MRNPRIAVAAVAVSAALCFVHPTVSFAQSAKSSTAAPLTLDDIFPEKKPIFGKTARALAWSHDDRYVAYLWNPYDDKGADLWLTDTKDGKSRRLTSIELFAAFDRDIPAIVARYAKDKAEDERRKTLSETERKKLEDDDKKKELERKEPLKEYVGVSEFAWAKKSDELLFVYRGDLYRLKLGQPDPIRLTRTAEAESGVRYTKDDDGFYFQRGSSVFKMRFDSPLTVQLNPELPRQMTLGSYTLSPDETKLSITSSRDTAPAREVSYISYRDRFAQAKTTKRDVGDDPVKSESYVFLYDLNDDPKQFPKNDGKPWEVYKRPEGEAGDISIADEPWSPDSKRFVFGAWKRDKKELAIVVAEPEAKKIRTVFTDTHNGEHRTPSLANPFFTPDGKHVVLMLERSGYRHAWWLDPLVEGATQITRGDFEAYPIKMTPKGELIVRSGKEDAARMDLYRVSVPDGAMTRLTKRDGMYGSPEISHDGAKMAVTFGSWKELTELAILSGGKESTVTASHADGALAKVTRVMPEEFAYQNRNGQTIHGFAFLPPGHKPTDRRPLLIYVYGGPLGTTKQVNNSPLGGDARFGMYLAANYGYITCTIDPRGSSGYGGVFGRSNYEAPGKAQVEDLVDGVKYLTEKYGVDSKKVGVSGWSFGGFQTQMCLYTAPETFTLGIAGAGPTEWQNYNTWYVGGVIGANKKADELDAFSLTKLAKNLQSPLLLLHGMEDTNVLLQDTIKVYRELLKAGKGPLVDLVLDPTGGHGLGGDIKTKDRFAIYEAFLLRNWGKYTPAATTVSAQK